MCEILSSASLLSENNGVRRPLTKPQKAKEVSEAIAQIGKDNLEGAQLLSSSLNNIAASFTNISTPSEVNPQQSQFDDRKIREFDDMKEDIANIKGTMAEILSHLKNK